CNEEGGLGHLLFCYSSAAFPPLLQLQESLMPKLNVVVLAAGKGTRMYSDKPKVLHDIAGKSLLAHVLGAARALEAERIVVVLGHQAEAVAASLAKHEVVTVVQEPQRGTAHAVQQALPQLDPEATVLVLYADVPLVRPQTLGNLLDLVANGGLGVLTCFVERPHGLGRIVRHADGSLARIVEERDATPEER